MVEPSELVICAEMDQMAPAGIEAWERLRLTAESLGLLLTCKDTRGADWQYKLSTETGFVYGSSKPRDIYCFLRGYKAREQKHAEEVVGIGNSAVGTSAMSSG